MKRTHRKHSAAFKTKVAIEAIKEQKTLSQISEQYSLHANQISDWKKTLVENAPLLFDKANEKKKDNQVTDLEALQAPYLEQIGLLQMEVSFLKKKLKQLGQV
jgi:transposase-like protein